METGFWLAVISCKQSRSVAVNLKKKREGGSCFSFMTIFFLFLAGDVVHPDAHMSNDCLLLELKEVVNYAVSFFLRKIDELRLRPDVVPRNKTPVNHTPSGALTICRLKITQRVPLINAAALRFSAAPGEELCGQSSGEMFVHFF